MRNVINGISKDNRGLFQEIKTESCWKKKYRLNGNYGALVFWDRRKNEVAYRLSPKIGINGGELTCENRAIKVLETIGHDSGLGIISMSKKVNAWEWSDSDIRPTHWLECASESDAIFRVSVATFLHELIHELRNENCMFDFSSHESRVCFSSPAGLPLRNFAKLDELPNDLKDQKAYFDFFEQLYLKPTDSSDFLYLVDEINGYIATTDTYALMFKKYGKSFSERREIILLPNAMFYTVRYLHKLSLANPDIFKTYFRNSENSKSLKLIFDRAETSYLTWERGLLQASLKPLKMESYFFKQYKTLRSNLGI